MVGAHAAGQVGASGDRGLPLPYDGREEFLVPRLHGDVHGTGGEVEGADGVAAQDGGLPDGQVVLVVGAAELAVGEPASASAVDEECRLVEVALFAGRSGQFDEGGLDLGVSAYAVDAAAAEGGAHVIGGPLGDLRELALATGADLSHARLDQVAVAVQLVAPFEVAVAGLPAGAAEGGVEVAVGFLGGGDRLGDRVGAGACPGHRFEQLVDVGVGELPSPPLLHGRAEVAGPADAFHPVAAVVEGGGGVDLPAPGPEAAGDPDLVEAERP